MKIKKALLVVGPVLAVTVVILAVVFLYKDNQDGDKPVAVLETAITIGDIETTSIEDIMKDSTTVEEKYSKLILAGNLKSTAGNKSGALSYYDKALEFSELDYDHKKPLIEKLVAYAQITNDQTLKAKYIAMLTPEDQQKATDPQGNPKYGEGDESAN